MSLNKKTAHIYFRVIVFSHLNQVESTDMETES